MVELGEAVGWIKLVVEQLGHQLALLAIGRDVAHQAHALRFARALVVERIPLVRRGQHDDLLKRIRAHERAHAGEAAGIVDAHAELDGAVVQHGDQPAARIAAVEQQVVRGQPVHVFEQELALATFVDVVQGGGEHQVWRRQEQAEQDLIGQSGALDMAGMQSEKMPINNFNFNEIDPRSVSWFDEEVRITISHVRQAIFDVSRDLVVAVVTNSNTALKVYGSHGLLMEKEMPNNSDFQYLLNDNNKGVLLVCSERSLKGDVLDWYYRIDLKNKSLIKDGRSY